MNWNLATFLLKMSIYTQLVVCRQKKKICEYIIWSPNTCKYIQQFILLKKPEEKGTQNKNMCEAFQVHPAMFVAIP